MLSVATGNALQEQMQLIRILETKLQALCDTGALAADLHMNTGQEAIAVGVCSALKDTDYLVCHHRMIAWAIAKGIPVEKLVAELCNGMAGEMHMRAMEYGLAHSFQLVGTVVPVAAGVAWALKNYKRNGGIAVAVFGDAATSNAQFHEGVNIAAVQKVPLLLVCENNHLAGNVRPKDYLPVDFIRQRAEAYGIEAASIDGNDLDAVIEAAREATMYVRQYCRPFLLECDTTRLGRHKQGQGDIRTKEEIAELSLRDPLRKVFIDPERAKEIKTIVDDAIGKERDNGS